MKPANSPQQEMTLEPVQSSTISAVGYDPKARELHVDFHQTGRYVYHGVSQQTYEGLMMSGSKGIFLHNHVKPRHHWSKV